MRYDADILIVGGGINGAGIARDAAGRGLSVVLCEQHDLAAHTSSASTKLIHGGLRYLEQYEFRLVAKALAERSVLLRLAPHIIWPLHFVLPHESHLRPVWMIRLGLLLYDKLGSSHRTLADSRSLDLTTHEVGAALRKHFAHGFMYSDAWVQDARLVVLNAMDAARRGADIRVRTRCVSARRNLDHWQAELDEAQGRQSTLRTRALVNATGPWAARFLDDVAAIRDHPKLRLVKGSHIVVPALFNHDYAYIFQQPDRRIVFAIPYENAYTLIGTTDVDYTNDPADVHIAPDEINYLCAAANRYFRREIKPADVVWSYSGVRPLIDDGNGDARSVSRDYRLVLDESDRAPLLNVFGGKITTHRRLSEEAVDKLAMALKRDLPAWTRDGDPLPGGDFGDAERLIASWAQRWPWLPVELAHRWLRHYGTCTEQLLDGVHGIQDFGEHFGAGLYRVEVDYLIDQEWARCADDIIWRRTKLGLRMTDDAIQRLDAYIAARLKSFGVATA
ncbi:MAG TPA: glycerol-3-phosphate dehydrogenase [Rudaea sp.]|nr:glycerol-3-phosphate dehydrogenase [Rudaea sp.]